jgi:hypothetical protein
MSDKWSFVPGRHTNRSFMWFNVCLIALCLFLVLAAWFCPFMIDAARGHHPDGTSIIRPGGDFANSMMTTVVLLFIWVLGTLLSFAED